MRVVKRDVGRGDAIVDRAYVEARLSDATRVIAMTPLAIGRRGRTTPMIEASLPVIEPAPGGTTPLPGRRLPVVHPDRIQQAIEAINWVARLEDADLMRLVLARAAGTGWPALAAQWGGGRTAVMRRYRRAIDLIVERVRGEKGAAGRKMRNPMFKSQPGDRIRHRILAKTD